MVMEKKGRQSARSVHHLATVETEVVTAEAAAEIVVAEVEIVVAAETVAVVVTADREDKNMGSLMGAFFFGQGAREQGARSKEQRDCQE